MTKSHKAHERVFYVYEHWRPDTDTCFYVGKGHGRRATKMQSRNPHHVAIQQKLAVLGMCVEVRLTADAMTEAEAFAYEVERIAYWRNSGVELVNYCLGGEGPTGRKHTEEWKQANSERTKGRRHTMAARKKIAESKVGLKTPATEAWLAQLHASNVGRPKKPGAVEKQAEKIRGRRHTPEAKAKMREARLAVLAAKRAEVADGESK